MHVSRIRRHAPEAVRAAGRVLRHSSPRSAPARALAATVLAAAVAGSVLAATRPDQRPHLAAQVRAITAAATRPGPRPVTLATGQQVQLTQRTAGGPSVVTPTPSRTLAAGAAGAATAGPVASVDIGGDTYAIPAYALPYLGSRLDPRLFDVSYLQRAGYSGLTALPLSISWQHRIHAAIPGITAPRTGLRTTGSIARGSAEQFGAAVLAALRAESGRGPASSRQAGLPSSAGLLSQVRKISLAPLPPAAPQPGTKAPQAARPDAPGAPGGPGLPAATAAPAVPLSASAAPPGTRLYSLTVHALDRTGHSSLALIAIQNLDHLQRYYSVRPVTPGTPLQVSLPAGRYGVEAVIYDEFAPNYPDSISFVPVPEVTVSRDTAVTVDARQARPVTVAVPRTAATDEAAITFARYSADGAGLSAVLYGFGPGASTILPALHVYAKPTSAPDIGSLDFADSWELVPPGTGAAGTGIPYAYSLDYASDHGVPAVLSHTLTDKDLATVQVSFDSSTTGDGGQTLLAPYQSWSPLAYSLGPELADSFPVPARQTEYFGGTAATIWDLSYQRWPASGVSAPSVYGPFQRFRPGERTSITWGASPSVPAPEWQDLGVAQWTHGSPGGANQPTLADECPVCRQGDVMSFDVAASGDSDPHHSESWLGTGSGLLTSDPGQPSDQLKFYRNGALTQVAAQSGQVFPMLPGKASYKIEWASTIPATWTRLATTVDSTWTFASARPDRASKLPTYQLCSPDANNACSYLPLVFASYDFGASQSGQVSAPGPETFTVTGYHEQGDTAPAVDHATVQVSFDDGATWTPATAVTALGGGKFKVTVQPPDPSATSGYASVRVHLADTAGDALDQTILRAYVLTGAAAAHGTGK